MDFSAIRENATQENAMFARLLAAVGGLLGGAGAMMLWGMSWSACLCTQAGVVGPMTLGWVNPEQTVLAVMLLLGGAAGAVAGYWAWLGLALALGRIAPLPASVLFKRAALPFVGFLPQLTYMLQGRPACVGPVLLFLALAAGVVLWAVVERKDKRKIFFTFPTESEYAPSGMFTHGAVMVLGTGLGWYLQSLPGLVHTSIMGVWFPAFIGVGVWMASLGVGSALGLLYTKHTFNQIYHAVALALLPLALLPLQSLSWAGYWENGALVSAFRLGAIPVIVGVLTGVAVPALFVLALLKLTARPLETQPAWEELFRALMLIAAIPLILVSVAYAPAGSALGPNALAGALDAIREGEPLASAQAILLGRLPFKEILLRHGFLSDAVTGLTALSWFGGTAEGLRLLTAWLIPLGVLGVYFLGVFCLPWTWVLVLMVALLSGKLGMVAETRFLFVWVGFIFTFLYLQRERWAFLIGSGVATVLAVIGSFSAGVMALTGHVVVLGAYALLGPAVNKRRWLGVVLYSAAALLGLLPWWMYLGMSGSLGDYFANFRWISTHYHAVFGSVIPAWGANPSLGTMLLFFLPPVLLLFGVWNIVTAIPKAKERGLPWNVLLLSTMIFFLWTRYIQRGDPTFLLEALPICALLAAFFLFRWSLSNTLLRSAILGGLVLWAFIPSAAGPTLPEVFGQFGTKNIIEATGLVKTQVAALGAVRVPPAQAKSLEELTGFLEGQVGSTETFYDFSNQPMLYFMVPRRPVVQSLLTATLATFQQQLDAIQSLADARVKAVVWGVTEESTVGNVPSELRQYALAEYLLQQFAPMALKGNAVLLGPKSETPVPDTTAAGALQRPLALGGVPAAWGKDSKYDMSQGAGAGSVVPVDGSKSFDPAGITVTAQGEALSVAPSEKELTLRLNNKADAGKRANVLVLQLTVPTELQGKSATLAWGDKASGRWVTFTLLGDGVSHPYVLRLGAVPAWVLGGEIASLQLTLPGGGWTWEKGQWLAIQDIPQIKSAAPKSDAPEAKGKQEKGTPGKSAETKK